MTAIDFDLDVSSLPQHLVLYDVSWEFYERLLKEIGERNLRVTFDNGMLEIMSPLAEHERAKKMIGRLIETMTEELGILIDNLGSTTLKRKDLEKGLEPDECYYVQNEPVTRSRKRLDLRKDPPPDLVIEADLTNRSVEKLPIYLEMGVPEVWHLDERGLRCLLLTRGKYRESDTSRAFPFLRISQIRPFVQMLGTKNVTLVIRQWRKWVRENFADKV